MSDLRQLEYLSELKHLRVLWMEENPCSVDPSYRSKVLRILPQLTMLDNTREYTCTVDRAKNNAISPSSSAVTREEVITAKTTTSSSDQNLSQHSRQSSLDHSAMSSSMISDSDPSPGGVYDVIPPTSEYAYISPPDEMTASVSASQYFECVPNTINDTNADEDATPVTEVSS